MEDAKSPQVHVVGGGTSYHVRPHVALSAVAYGGTARHLKALCDPVWGDESVHLHLTRMAQSGRGDLETNSDIKRLLVQVVADPSTRVIFLPVALVSFTGSILSPHSVPTESGRQEPRLRSRDGRHAMILDPASKLIPDVRRYRKDIFLVGFKTTTGASEDVQFEESMELLKGAACNLVFASDIQTRMNMIVTPEHVRHCVTQDRHSALERLVTMVSSRSRLTFTRTKSVPGEAVPWGSDLVPEPLRALVDHCVRRGAYRSSHGSTAGHFAVRLADGRLLLSIRNGDFCQIRESGTVACDVDQDSVTAHGAKPSAGAKSQYFVFRDHPDIDCVVHFHSPFREGRPDPIPVREQWPFECGSHECGINVSSGLRRFGNLYAVMLRGHGPSIGFSRSCDPSELIRFVESNFDLLGRTDGVLAEVSPSVRDASPLMEAQV